MRDGYEICGACNGSGEGMYDGSTCLDCKGKGSVRAPEDDDTNSEFGDATLEPFDE